MTLFSYFFSRIDAIYHRLFSWVTQIKQLFVVVLLGTIVNFVVIAGLSVVIFSPELILLSQFDRMQIASSLFVPPGANPQQSSQQSDLVIAEGQGHQLQLHQNDPVWDGVLTGASMGLLVEQAFPFQTGLVLCPLLGMIAGYQMDAKL